MASYLEFLQSPSAPRRGVQVYAPGRNFNQPAPPRARRRTKEETEAALRAVAEDAEGRASPWEGFVERVGRSESVQKSYQKQAQDQAEAEMPWWKQGLGMVLSNPITKAGLYALEPLDYARRAAQVGILETGEALASGSRGTKDQEQYERVRDDRSNLEMIFGKEPIVGKNFTDQFVPNKYGMRGLTGFAADVATDPLTYITGGATKLVPVGEKMIAAASHVDEAARGLQEVKASIHAAQEMGDVNSAIKILGEQLPDAERAHREAQAAVEVLKKDPSNFKQVRVHGGRKARATFLAELAETNPEAAAKYADEIARVGERGLNTASPELRGLYGYEPSKLRFMGRPIPRTEQAGRLVAEAGGKMRQGLNKIPGAEKLMRGTKGAEDAFANITRGQPGDVLTSLTKIRYADLYKQGRQVEGLGNQALRELHQELANLGKDATRQATHEAETVSTPNQINDFFKKVRQIYQDTTGSDLADAARRNPDTYLPHIQTPQARRYLKEKVSDKVLKQMGFMQEDLLEGSGYLRKARKLQPKVDEAGNYVPTTFKIGDQEITLTDGSVRELNEELARVFTDFKGKFYQDDPIAIGEAYVSSLAKDAGRDIAINRLAASGNPQVLKVEGALGDALRARNEVLSERTNPGMRWAQQYKASGGQMGPMPEMADMPDTVGGVDLDEFFSSAVHKGDTRQQNIDAEKLAKEVRKDLEARIESTHEQVREQVNAVRQNIYDGLGTIDKDLREQQKLIETKFRQVRNRLKAIDETMTKKVVNARTADEIFAVNVEINQHLSDLRNEIAKINRNTTNRLRAEVPKLKRGLEAKVRAYQDLATKSEEQLKKLPARLREEARVRREQLEAPLRRAEAVLKDAQARVPGAPDQARIDAALDFVRKQYATTEEYEAALAAYREADAAFQALPYPERVKPTSEQIDEAVAAVQAKAAPTPPPAAAPTPPPAVAAPTPPPAAAVPPPPAEEVFNHPLLRQGEEALPPPTVAAPTGTDAERAQQLLKTANKMVSDAERRFQEAATALSEASTMGADPEQIRKLDYAVHAMQTRLDDARNTLRFAEQGMEKHAAPAAAPEGVEAAEQELTRQAVRMAKAIDARDAAAAAGKDTAPFVADIEQIKASMRQAEKALERRKGEVAAEVAHPTTVDETMQALDAMGEIDSDEALRAIEEGGIDIGDLSDDDLTELAQAIEPGAAAPTEEDWRNARDVLIDELTPIVGEENLDQVEAIYTLSDLDTQTFLNQMWDVLPPSGQDRLSRIHESRTFAEDAAPVDLRGAGAAAPEQLALPPGAAAAERRRIGGITKKNKRATEQGVSIYDVDDGVDQYTVRKNDDGQWLVSTNKEQTSPKAYRTLQQVGEAIDRGDHRAAEAITEEAVGAVPEIEVTRAYTQGADGNPKATGWQVIADGEWVQTFRTKKEAEAAVKDLAAAPPAAAAEEAVGPATVPAATLEEATEATAKPKGWKTREAEDLAAFEAEMTTKDRATREQSMRDNLATFLNPESSDVARADAFGRMAAMNPDLAKSLETESLTRQRLTEASRELSWEKVGDGWLDKTGTHVIEKSGNTYTYNDTAYDTLEQAKQAAQVQEKQALDEALGRTGEEAPRRLRSGALYDPESQYGTLQPGETYTSTWKRNAEGAPTNQDGWQIHKVSSEPTTQRVRVPNENGRGTHFEDHVVPGKKGYIAWDEYRTLGHTYKSEAEAKKAVDEFLTLERGGGERRPAVSPGQRPAEPEWYNPVYLDKNGKPVPSVEPPKNRARKLRGKRKPVTQQERTEKQLLSSEQKQALDRLRAARERYHQVAGQPGARQPRIVEPSAPVAGEAAPPLPHGRRSAYDEARNEIAVLTHRIDNEAMEEAERAALTRQRKALQRKFNRGGKFYEESKARKTIFEQMDYERRVAEATATEQAAVDAARGQKARQMEAVVSARDTTTGVETRLPNPAEGGRTLGQERVGRMPTEAERPIGPPVSAEAPKMPEPLFPDVAGKGIDRTKWLTYHDEVNEVLDDPVKSGLYVDLERHDEFYTQLGQALADLPKRLSGDEETMRSLTAVLDLVNNAPAELNEAAFLAAGWKGPNIPKLKNLDDIKEQIATYLRMAATSDKPDKIPTGDWVQRQINDLTGRLQEVKRKKLTIAGRDAKDLPLRPGARATETEEARAMRALGREALTPEMKGIYGPERAAAAAATGDVGARTRMESLAETMVDPETGEITRLAQPVTEQQAINKLETMATMAETPAGRTPDQQAIANQARAYRGKEAEEAAKLATQPDELATTIRREGIAEGAEKVANEAVLSDVAEVMADRGAMAQAREAVKAQKKALGPKATKWTKDAELAQAINDVEAVAKANPQLNDPDLNATEALLNKSAQQVEELGRMRGGLDTTKRLQKAAERGKLQDVVYTTTSSNWKMIYKATTGGKAALQEGDIIVQRELADMMQNLHALSKEPGLFGRTFNAMTNLFKTYATLSPGFHVRNALSAIFMNTSDGVALRAQLNGARLWRQFDHNGAEWLRNLSDDTLREMGVKMTADQVRDAFKATFASGAGGRFEEAGFAEITEGGRWIDKLERVQRNRVTKLSQRGGTKVEGAVRLGMALDSIAMGESVESALSRIARVHFDYADLSSFDEQMKRLIPFWTFMSRNLPLQISQMWTKPRSYAILEHAKENFGQPDVPFTPEYMKNAGAFNTGMSVPGIFGMGGAQGLPILAAPDLGYQRVQQDVQMLTDALSGKNYGAALSNFNPLLTAPFEFMTKQDIYTGRQYENTDYSDANGPLGLIMKMIATPLGQTNEKGQVADIFTNTLRAINPVYDRQARLLPQLEGGNASQRQRQMESVLRFLGAPVRTLTPGQQESEAYRRYYDWRDEIERQQAMARPAAS